MRIQQPDSGELGASHSLRTHRGDSWRPKRDVVRQRRSASVQYVRHGLSHVQWRIAAATQAYWLLGGSPIWLRPRRIASSGSLRLLWLRPESACDPRLLRPWLDDPGHDPAVLADLAVTGEPELLVGRKAPLNRNPAGTEPAPAGYPLTVPPPRPAMRSNAPVRPGQLPECLAISGPCPLEQIGCHHPRAFLPHHVTLPPVYTPPGGTARGRPVSRRRGVCTTDRPNDPSAGSCRGSWKRPWRLTMESSVSTGRVASAVLDRRRRGR
jgi:hypothetical protein